MSYHASISADSTALQGDLMGLRSSLASTNWMLRALGVPTDQRRALMEIQKAIRIIRICQMVSQGSGLMSLGSMGLRAIGLGNAVGGVRIVRKLSNLTGGGE